MDTTSGKHDSGRGHPAVLFVCLGNYCRSPAAEGVFRYLAKQDPETQDMHIESCGVTDSFLGHLPDERMQEVARRRGVVLCSRAQIFQVEFFDRFDYILVVTRQLLKFLEQHARTPEHKAKLHLMTDFSTQFVGQEIPDPFYQDEKSFDTVLDMIEDCCEGLLQHIKNSKTQK